MPIESHVSVKMRSRKGALTGPIFPRGVTVSHVVEDADNPDHSARLVFDFDADSTVLLVTAYDAEGEMQAEEIDLVAMWERLTP